MRRLTLRDLALVGQAAGGIKFVGATSAASTSTSAPSGQQTGDLQVVVATGGTSTFPSLPSGWTNIANEYVGAATARIGYRFATSSSSNSGTWTNANKVVMSVYRGADSSNPIGASATGGGYGLAVTYPALALENTDGTSWVFLSGLNTSTADDVGTPTGATKRESRGNPAPTVLVCDTDEAVSSWSSVDADNTSGLNRGWTAFSIELRAA